MVSAVEKSQLNKIEAREEINYQFLPLAMCPLPPKQLKMNEFENLK